MNFHAHVYYPLEEKSKAEAVHAAIALQLQGKFSKLSDLNDRPVGPHPLPTFEVHFVDADLKPFRSLLEEYRQGLSVLIHIDTGDDHLDHRENIEWLGDPVKLDFGFFDLIQKHPELRINK
jgi:DOPA 4,5-dioxygenase